MFHKNDPDATIGLIGTIFLLIVFACASGYNWGIRKEKADAVKAGVAHWVADEKGDAKFEYNK